MSFTPFRDSYVLRPCLTVISDARSKEELKITMNCLRSFHSHFYCTKTKPEEERKKSVSMQHADMRERIEICSFSFPHLWPQKWASTTTIPPECSCSYSLCQSIMSRQQQRKTISSSLLNRKSKTNLIRYPYAALMLITLCFGTVIIILVRSAKSLNVPAEVMQLIAVSIHLSFLLSYFFLDSCRVPR
jgi:hypothetical protein